MNVRRWENIASSRDKLKYSTQITDNGKIVAHLEKTSDMQNILSYELNIEPSVDIEQVMNFVISLIASEFVKYTPIHKNLPKKLKFVWNTSYPEKSDVKTAFQRYGIDFCQTG